MDGLSPHDSIEELKKRGFLSEIFAISLSQALAHMENIRNRVHQYHRGQLKPEIVCLSEKYNSQKHYILDPEELKALTQAYTLVSQPIYLLLQNWNIQSSSKTRTDDINQPKQNISSLIFTLEKLQQLDPVIENLQFLIDRLNTQQEEVKLHEQQIIQCFIDTVRYRNSKSSPLTIARLHFKYYQQLHPQLQAYYMQQLQPQQAQLIIALTILKTKPKIITDHDWHDAIYVYFSTLITEAAEFKDIYIDFERLIYPAQKILLEKLQKSYGETHENLLDYVQTMQQDDGMSYHIQYEREQWQLDLETLFIDETNYLKAISIDSNLKHLPKITISLAKNSKDTGITKKNYFLHPKAVKKLLDKNIINSQGEIHPKDKHNSPQSKHSHQNVFNIERQINGREIAVHFKVEPELPGFERMHNLLAPRITGCGLNQSEIIEWQVNTQNSMTILLTKTIKQVITGLNLHDYLNATKEMENETNLFKKLNTAACMRDLLSFFIIGEEDGKTNNYIVINQLMVHIALFALIMNVRFYRRWVIYKRRTLD